MKPSILARRILRSRWFIGLAIGLLLYAAAGFLLLPALVRAKLPVKLSAMLHREVTVARVRANPFALSLTLDGFRVKDRDGSPLLGWDRLYVNLAAQSLFRLSPVFQEIRLEGFRARVALDRHGNPTFADLLTPGPPSAAPSGPPPDIRIQHLAVVGARVDFLDQATSQPFATSLGPLSLSLDGFRLSRDNRNPYAFSGRTERGETFGWQGHFLLEPMRSQGSFHVGNLYLPKYAPFYRDGVAFEVLGGTLDFKAGYDFTWGEGMHAFRLLDGEAGLHNLAVGEGGKPAVELPEVHMAGLEADLLEGTARVASLTLKDGRLQVRRDADGTLNLMRMAASRRPPEPPPEKPFRFTLDELRVENQSVALQDLAAPRPVTLALDQINATVKHFSLDPAQRCDLDLDLRWNGRGRVHASGQAAPMKSAGALDLRVEGLDLPPLGGYLPANLGATLVSGRLGITGHADFDLPASTYAVKGQAQVDGFRLNQGEAFLAWDSLRVAGLKAAPGSLAVASIDWNGPSGRYVLLPTKTAPPPPEARPAAAPLKAELGVFRVKGGSFTLLDRTLPAVAALSLEGLEGQVGRLSSDPAARAQVELKARVDGMAPLTVKGTVNLLSQATYTDLKLVMGGMDLSPLSPYAGYHLGYGIEKGKLELDLAYSIQETRLQGENHLRMDQFTLGEATNSPEAVHLPIKLGLALLRDRHGVIELDVPVRGDLAQPDFKLSGVIWHAVLNVFAKLATSPFALLGKAFGGGDADLSLLTFQPGSEALDAQALKVLETLEKGLYERPGLRLEMEGTTDAAQDGPVLRRLELEAALQRLKGEPLASGERAKFLRAAYLEAFPPPRDAKAPEPSPADMEARLLERIPVDAGALKLLARRRVQAVWDRLRASGRVEEARLFLAEGGDRARRDGGCRVYFELK